MQIVQILNDGVAEIMVVIHVPGAESYPLPVPFTWFHALASLFNKDESKREIQISHSVNKILVSLG